MVEKIKDLQPPRGVARLGWRAPIWFYRLRLGSLLGGRFVLLNPIGRQTGKPRQAVLEVVHHNKEAGAYVMVSGCGENFSYVPLLEKPCADTHRRRSGGGRVTSFRSAQARFLLLAQT